MREIPVGAGDLYARLHRFAGRLVDDPSRQPTHDVLLSRLIRHIPVGGQFGRLWYRKDGATGASGNSYEWEGVNFTITARNSRNLLHHVAFCRIFLVIVKFRAGYVGWSAEEPLGEKVRFRGTFRDIL